MVWAINLFPITVFSPVPKWKKWSLATCCCSIKIHHRSTRLVEARMYRWGSNRGFDSSSGLRCVLLCYLSPPYFSSLLSTNVLKILINGTSHLLEFALTDKESPLLFRARTHTTGLRHWDAFAAGSAAMDMQISVTERTYMAMLPAVMLHASNRGRSFQGILLSLYRKQ